LAADHNSKLEFFFADHPSDSFFESIPIPFPIASECCPDPAPDSKSGLSARTIASIRASIFVSSGPSSISTNRFFCKVPDRPDWRCCAKVLPSSHSSKYPLLTWRRSSGFVLGGPGPPGAKTPNVTLSIDGEIHFVEWCRRKSTSLNRSTLPWDKACITAWQRHLRGVIDRDVVDQNMPRAVASPSYSIESTDAGY
jgi:hypothetical protein